MITDVELTPLLEKLRIGQITVSLKETKKIKTVPGPDYHPERGWEGMWREEYEVKQVKMEVPEGSEAFHFS